MSNLIYEDEYKYPLAMMLNVTDDCNLQCRYCFVEQHPHYMTLETAKTAADWLYQNYLMREKLNLKSGIPNIYFFGGEPTLCYDSIIVPLVAYCKEKYPNFTFGMTTNGTLLNKERIDFLKENNFNLLLSIDGAKETQDYNRPCRDCKQSSFDLLEKNIPYLLKNFPNLCFRSTIYAPTVNHLFENYLYAEFLGFKYYEMIEDNRHEWNEEQKESLQKEFSKIYLYQTQQILNNIKPMKVTKIETFFNILTHLVEDDHYYSINTEEVMTLKRCGLGTTTCSVGWDGNIYGCQEQVSKDNKNLFFIGNINNGGIDEQKHKKLLMCYQDGLLNQTNKYEKCENCLLKDVCKMNIFICPSTTYDLYSNMYTITDINCFIRQLYIKNSILHLNLLDILYAENGEEKDNYGCTM